MKSVRKADYNDFDLAVIVGRRQFCTHWSVLRENSVFFDEFYSQRKAKLKKTRDSKATGDSVFLKGISEDLFGKFLCYVYTNTTEVNEPRQLLLKDVKDVLHFSVMFEIRELMNLTETNGHCFQDLLLKEDKNDFHLMSKLHQGLLRFLYDRTVSYRTKDIAKFVAREAYKNASLECLFGVLKILSNDRGRTMEMRLKLLDIIIALFTASIHVPARSNVVVDDNARSGQESGRQKVGKVPISRFGSSSQQSPNSKSEKKVDLDQKAKREASNTTSPSCGEIASEEKAKKQLRYNDDIDRDSKQEIVEHMNEHCKTLQNEENELGGQYRQSHSTGSLQNAYHNTKGQKRDEYLSRERCVTRENEHDTRGKRHVSRIVEHIRRCKEHVVLSEQQVHRNGHPVSRNGHIPKRNGCDERIEEHVKNPDDHDACFVQPVARGKDDVCGNKSTALEKEYVACDKEHAARKKEHVSRKSEPAEREREDIEREKEHVPPDNRTLGRAKKSVESSDKDVTRGHEQVRRNNETFAVDDEHTACDNTSDEDREFETNLEMRVPELSQRSQIEQETKIIGRKVRKLWTKEKTVPTIFFPAAKDESPPYKAGEGHDFEKRELSKRQGSLLKPSVYGKGLGGSTPSVHRKRERLLLTGGIQKNGYFARRSVLEYDPVSNLYITHNPMKTSRYNHGVCQLGTDLYFVGGNSGLFEQLRSVERYSMEHAEWITEKSLQEPRDEFSLVVCDGFLYAIGGHNGIKDLRSVEKFGTGQECWNFLRPMNHCRAGASAVAVNDRYIYVAGGFNGQVYLSSVEEYDTLTDSWTKVEPMNNKRAYSCLVLVDRDIYVLGGFNGQNTMSSCEVYNMEKGSWTVLPDMNTPRMNAAAAAAGAEVFVFGGEYESVFVETVECYNTKSTSWRFVQRLPQPIAGLRACVYDQQQEDVNKTLR